MKVSILTALIALLPAQAIASEQFNLVCKGARVTDIEGQAKPFDFTLRIDIAAKQWCWTECDQILNIANVFPDRIVFMDVDEDTFRRKNRSTAEVSRVTGVYKALWIQIRPFPTYLKTDAQCVRSDFTGFPKAQF